MFTPMTATPVRMNPCSRCCHEVLRPCSCRGVEVETRPSRLGLARVSIVRGSGPLSGQACIDDYIRAVEPVFDYLTKYSGLVRCLF
jgi:hypothetical protein